jgi:hypothetical protein
MPVAIAHLRVFRIHRNPEGGFEIRNEFPKDAPLGIDTSLEQAVATAHREALMESRKGSVVVIETQHGDKWIEVDRVEPPATPLPRSGEAFHTDFGTTWRA